MTGAGEAPGSGGPESSGAPADLDEAPEPEKTPFALVAQFFLIPLLVVVAAVALFLLFGMATREKKSAGDYVAEVRNGGMNRQKQAAYELAILLARKPELAHDRQLFADVLATFEAAAGKDDPLVRRYLALALGRFKDAAAVPALIKALADEDEETRIYAVLALASIGDSAAIEPLIALLKTEEPTLRRTAAFALGTLKAKEALPALRVTADDPRLDVALQGALALAQLGDGSGAATLRRALEPGVFAGAAAMRPEQEADAVVSAIRGLVLIGDREALPVLARLAKDHPSLAVRDAALAALAALK